MTIATELQKPVVSPYLELWDIDGHLIDASLVWHFTAHSDFPIGFAGITYSPFPISGTGYETTSGQPPRPKLQISNITKLVQPYIQEHQQLARVMVTRRRTLFKFTDGQSTADGSQQLPPDVYFINRLTKLEDIVIEFELVSAMELPGLKLPMGQALRNRTDVPANLWAPGLSSVRGR